MLTGVELPFRFDVEALRADLAAVPGSAWSPHYNERDYGGIWRGAALRSASGSAGRLNAVGSSFGDTPLLDLCPYFREVLNRFECRLKSARLLSLAPGSFIREHTDHALDFEDGEVRIHVPVQTNADVEFYVSGERLLLAEGGAYYVNVNLPHRVSNRGAADRVHLVIDAEVNDWVRELFGRSSSIARGAPRSRGVEQFRDAAMADAALRGMLESIADPRQFEAEAVTLGRARGFDFHEGDVHAALQASAAAGSPGGLPFELRLRDGRPFLTWMDAPDRRLPEPFFEDSVRSRLRGPWTRFSRRSAPLDVSAAPRRLKGLIFHVSRCGSTLVSQMLKAAGYRVIAEAPMVDDALRTRPAWLPALSAALEADFLKLDAWHIHRMDEFRAVFPGTPWIFLHRETSEVVASHRRRPGMHALPGAMDPEALRMTFEDVTSLGQDAWIERVIGKIRASSERHRADPAGLFVDYRELPDAAWAAVARHFRLELSAAQLERMRDASRHDAKTPGALFV